MSKAFTTDSDEEGGQPEAPALPPGTRNYMTRVGAERLRAEAEQLTQERRGLNADVEGKARAQAIERRLRFLVLRLQALEVIDPLLQPKDRVLFGATVTLSDEKKGSETWRIVGLDEADLERGWISWMSPLAGALLEKRAGDVITFMSRRLTVQKIYYEA
jgi:transcription elongation factor GreB